MSEIMPICDFTSGYAKSGAVRFHMPGHKGRVMHGLEPLDITEIDGADYLYGAEGIILQSRRLTSSLYGSAETFYSAEGSSLSIKTMLGLAQRLYIQKGGKGRMKILAARNCHRAFISGCILLDISPIWLYPPNGEGSLCACPITADTVRAALEKEPDCGGVYVTSPDYPGNMADIAAISQVCREKNVPLMADNAHGAYLKFVGEGLHPLDLGADMCADSAHKTLPVYTGGGYLHISKDAPEIFSRCAEEIMAMFASTSPSYLIMGSLDRCAAELRGDLPQRIRQCCERVALCKKRLAQSGWNIGGGEPMKITVYPSEMGYTGDRLAQILRDDMIECEYSDRGALVLMPSPFNGEEDFLRLEKAMAKIERKEPLSDGVIPLPRAQKACEPRQAAFSAQEETDVSRAEGRICGMSAISCQPSVPIIVSGEIFSDKIIKILKSYSIFKVNVLK